MESESGQPTFPPLGGALALLKIPYIFSQDDLLTTGEFITKSEEYGHSLSLDGLQALHSHGLLVPLYRVSDTAVEKHRIQVEANGLPNARGWTLEAGADGRLIDAAAEGYSEEWPYELPADETPRQWWNGFIYSSWQILEVDKAVKMYEFVKLGSTFPAMPEQQVRQRRLTLALSALATRYLPGVLGQISMTLGDDEDGLWQHRVNSDVRELLQIAGINAADLVREADSLLIHAHREPLAKWLPLLRYASYNGWSKLKGEPLESMWRRVGAEVLLRAYEDLATDGHADPLPDLNGSQYWSAQHDRLTPRYSEAETLERALADLGLSPHPKVIVLVEGETELHHVPRLLQEFDISQPQDVRVQRTKGSKVNAHLIARYGVTPRIGRRIQDCWLLDASPTALLIAMDAENDFETPAKRDDVRRKLQEAIREEVKYQDADISQDELDILVNIRVRGDDKYELANFTDDELVPAITAIAATQTNSLVHSATWEKDLRSELQAARAAHEDIKVPLGHMRVKEDKVELARILWPVLRAKCEAEYVADMIVTPVLKVVVEVRQLITKVAGVRALMVPPNGP
jgi:hypothetical protein